MGGQVPGGGDTLHERLQVGLDGSHPGRSHHLQAPQQAAPETVRLEANNSCEPPWRGMRQLLASHTRWPHAIWQDAVETAAAMAAELGSQARQQRTTAILLENLASDSNSFVSHTKWPLAPVGRTRSRLRR